MLKSIAWSVIVSFGIGINGLAAPPIQLPPSNPGGSQPLWQPTTSTTQLSAHPHPPEEGYLFYVKNTKIIVKFKNYIQMNNRNETEVAQVLRAATADVFKSGKTPVMPEFDHIWRAGQVDLEVSPQKGKLEQKQALTWTWWHAAITAFREFTKEYPGLCFQYELFVNDKDDRGKEDEFWLGEGLLGFW